MKITLMNASIDSKLTLRQWNS